MSSKQYMQVDEDHDEGSAGSAAVIAIPVASQAVPPAGGSGIAGGRRHRTRPQALVLFDYSARNERELSLRVGDTVDVLDSSDLDWWEGELEDGRVGVFPSNYCKLLSSQSAEQQRQALEPLPPVVRLEPVAGTSTTSPPPERRDSRTFFFLHRPHTPLPKLPKKPKAWHRRMLAWWRRFLFPRVLLYLGLCGVVTPCVSAAMDYFVIFCYWLHSAPFDALKYWQFQLAYWIAFSLVLTTIAVLLTKYLSPHAAGSGVPEVKVILSGVDMPQYMSFRTLFSKVVGLSLVLGSGLFAGKQGPMVHIGAMIALLLAKIPGFRFLQESPDLRMQILTAGTACGISSHFGTPIAGLLFTIEISPSYYSVRNYWLAALSSVVGSLLMRLFYNLDHLTTASPFDSVFAGLIPNTHSFHEDYLTLGLSAVVGVFCGFLAILFCYMTEGWFNLRKRFSARLFIFRYPILYALIITTITCLVTFPRFFGEYMAQNAFPTIRNLLYEQTNATASSSIGSSVTLGAAPGQFGPWHPVLGLFIMLLFRFLLTSAAVPLPLPIGLYATNLIIGAIFGRFFGELIHMALPIIDSNVIAMISAAAYVGAVTHTHSSAVVLLEMTGTMAFCLHSFFATTIAISISRLASESIFDKIIRLRSLPFLSDFRFSPKPLIAKDIMLRQFRTVKFHMTLGELRTLLHEDHSSAYAVVSEQHGQYRGTIERFELMRLVARAELSPIDEPDRIIQLNYQPAAVTVLENTPLSQLHLFFITMRLQYAFVTRLGEAVGLITREELSNALKSQVKLIQSQRNLEALPEDANLSPSAPARASMLCVVLGSTLRSSMACSRSQYAAGFGGPTATAEGVVSCASAAASHGPRGCVCPIVRAFPTRASSACSSKSVFSRLCCCCCCSDARLFAAGASEVASSCWRCFFSCCCARSEGVSAHASSVSDTATRRNVRGPASPARASDVRSVGSCVIHPARTLPPRRERASSSSRARNSACVARRIASSSCVASSRCCAAVGRGGPISVAASAVPVRSSSVGPITRRFIRVWTFYEVA